MSSSELEKTPLSNTSIDSVTEQLRDKIKSKMDVAKFFAGFITVFLGVAFNSSSLLNDHIRVVWYGARAGVLFILAALAFSVAAMFTYDGLLMPPMAGEEKPTDTILRRKMVKAWDWFFVPAVLAFFIGLFGFLIALMQPSWRMILVLVIPFVIPWLIYRLYWKKKIRN